MRPSRRWRKPVPPPTPKTRSSQVAENKRGRHRERLWWQVYRWRCEQGLEHCRGCGEQAINLTFDHLLPASMGGNPKFSNMTLLCPPCNNGKGVEISFELISLAAEEASAPAERRWFEITRAHVEALQPHRKCPECLTWQIVRLDNDLLEAHGPERSLCPGGYGDRLTRRVSQTVPVAAVGQ